MPDCVRLFIDKAPEGGQPRPHQGHDAWYGLEPSEVHYATRVLRAQDGAAIEVLDGLGQKALGRLVARGKTFVAELLGPWHASAPWHELPYVRVVVAMPKGDRADWMVEKLVELGIAEIWPATFDFSQAERPEASRRRHDRLVRLARAAARQARHGRLPFLPSPQPLLEALMHWRPANRPPCADEEVLRMIAHPSVEGTLNTCGRLVTTSKPALRSLVIGPEGGLTPDELRAAMAQGYRAHSLGPHILRVETAALAMAVRFVDDK